MTANETAGIVVALSKQLAEGVRDGTITVADARAVVSAVREARGWLLTVENELDPEQPVAERTDVS